MAEIGEDKDLLNELFMQTNNDVSEEMENYSDMLGPALVIDIESIDKEAKEVATYIVEKMANFYFDESWVRSHPYIIPKIGEQVDTIRRLKKMLKVNELAQDNIIQGITCNAAKGTLYSALTSLQDSMLKIQKQMDDIVNEMEAIFKKMQDECQVAFKDKEKEEEADGTLTARGSKEFIKELTQRMYGEKKMLIDTSTGEIISSTTNYTIEE